MGPENRCGRHTQFKLQMACASVPLGLILSFNLRKLTLSLVVSLLLNLTPHFVFFPHLQIFSEYLCWGKTFSGYWLWFGMKFILIPSSTKSFSRIYQISAHAVKACAPMHTHTLGYCRKTCEFQFIPSNCCLRTHALVLPSLDWT